MSYAIAKAQAALGRKVFPVDGKKPLVKWTREATTNPRRIRAWWKVWPEAGVGWALPEEYSVVDIDDPDVFSETGLALSDSYGQTTPRGYHVLYRTDQDLEIKQGAFKGGDIKVGGKGYVKLYSEDAFTTSEEWTTWDLKRPPPLLSSDIADLKDRSREEKRGKKRPNGNELHQMGTREEILEWLGALARAGLTKDEYLATMQSARDTGRIIDLDETRPWTDKDLQTLANEAAVWEQAEDLAKLPQVNFIKKKHEVRDLSTDNRFNAAALVEQEIDPLEYVIDEIMPTGLGLISGAPKVGKSWLVLQNSIQIVTEGEILGRSVLSPRPVLYYALEDGLRRLQTRTMQLMGAEELDLSLLEFRLEAPTIGNGLEEEICLFLDDNEEDGVVILDVLAMVRPQAKGRGSAYDEDYSVMKPLRKILSTRPGATIIAVTHDRKAGSDDFLTTVTGTRGVTGAVDWAWVIKRQRLVPKGLINVIGRDIHEQAIDAIFTGAWMPTAPSLGGTSQPQEEILEALLTEGDMTTKELIHFLYPETKTDKHEYKNKQSATSEKLNKLLARTAVAKSMSGSQATWHVMTPEEVKKKYLAARHQSEASMPSPVTIRKVKTT